MTVPRTHQLGTGPLLEGTSAGTARGRRLRPFLNVYWGLLAVFVLVAVLAPVIAPFDPVEADLSSKLLPPSSTHLFGTDSNGMDIFSRVLWATRTDFTIALLGVGIGLSVGVPLGALAGFFGGWPDEILSRISDMIQSIPFLLFALMVFAALGNSRAVLVGFIAFVDVPVFLKLTRAVVLPLRHGDLVAAARCSGLSQLQIVARHVMPNALGPVASQVSIQCAYAIQVIAGLSFLGLGVPLPEPEWGSMIQEGAGRIMSGDWWVSVFPGIAVLLAVITFGGLGRQLGRWYGR